MSLLYCPLPPVTARAERDAVKCTRVHEPLRSFGAPLITPCRSASASERVQALRYLQLSRQLLSCSADGGIAVWNMDTQREEVSSAFPASPNARFHRTYLMVLARPQAPQWLDSDSCQKCEQPFFWNIKQMWDSKTLGLRQVRDGPPGSWVSQGVLRHTCVCPQHHCRKCGQAVCGKCSSKRSTYPIMGFEFPVRMCDACFDTIKEEE